MVSIQIEMLEQQFPKLHDITELKTGGQKAVYSAMHSEHGGVVLKVVIREGDDPRIIREIEIVKNNSFPNVPQIFEVGNIAVDNNSYSYICEQRVSGSDLRSVLETKGTFILAMVLDFLRGMLNTIARLEKKGIVHRDIKPENILLDEQGNYWLIDFGIARDTRGASLTATSANFGPHTAGYAAPEQYRNQKRQIDSRADLFSIGVVAYEMLHGFNPFTKNAKNVIDIYKKTESFTEDPLAIPGDINGDLSGFIQTLMQKSHTYRPPSAAMALSWFSEIANNLEEETSQ